jgi:hypothetical protein
MVDVAVGQQDVLDLEVLPVDEVGDLIERVD